MNGAGRRFGASCPSVLFLLHILLTSSTMCDPNLNPVT